MSATKLRLALHLSSIRRRFPDDGFFNLLAQNGDFIVTQRGHHIVTQDEVNAPDIVENLSILLTQSGDLIVNQGGNPIVTNQNIADDVLDLVVLQNGDNLITQDGRNLGLDHAFSAGGNNFLTQDGNFITAQDGKILTTERLR